MKDVEVLENNRIAFRIGRAWFRSRSFSPLPFLALFLILPADFTPTSKTILLSVSVVALAEIIRIWAVGYAGSATRTRGDSVPVLVIAGPYRFVRNPLYIGNILMYTAAGFLFGHLYLSIAFFFYSAMQYSFIVHYEETILEKIFGRPYEDFKKQVGRWLPNVSAAPAASPHTFSLRSALRSEKSTFFSLAGVAALFILKQKVR